MQQLPQVRYIARRIHTRLPHYIPLEDLVNTGVLGLIEALSKFDPKRKVQLQSYTRHRIQCAILDSLREQDWSPRLLRRKERQLESTREKLQIQLGRVPTQAELAAGLGISVRKLQRLLCDLRGLEVSSLQEPIYLEGRSLEDRTAETAEESPFSLCERAEMKGLLEQAISKLPPRARRVLELYYFKGLNMKETGIQMGVGESRVSQIHSSAVGLLKARMKEVLTARHWKNSIRVHPRLATPVPQSFVSVKAGAHADLGGSGEAPHGVRPNPERRRLGCVERLGHRHDGRDNSKCSGGNALDRQDGRLAGEGETRQSWHPMHLARLGAFTRSGTGLPPGSAHAGH